MPKNIFYFLTFLCASTCFIMACGEDEPITDDPITADSLHEAFSEFDALRLW